MRKQTAVAMALLHNPDVLFLDEPFEAIDPVTSRVMHELLIKAAQRGVTIFLTSHILSTVERIAQQFVILREGSVYGMPSRQNCHDRSKNCISNWQIRLPSYISVDQSDGQKYFGS
jgi:ABC-2 type transport system ATP-binding protein